jgi:hypothetical protein
VTPIDVSAPRLRMINPATITLWTITPAAIPATVTSGRLGLT